MQKLAPRSDARVLSLAGGLDDVVEEAGNGEGADAAEFWGDECLVNFFGTKNG